MAACPHRRLVYVPSETDPELLAEVCLDCHVVLGVSGPDDPELRAIGESLGDPDPEENPGRASHRRGQHDYEVWVSWKPEWKAKVRALDQHHARQKGSDLFRIPKFDVSARLLGHEPKLKHPWVDPPWWRPNPPPVSFANWHRGGQWDREDYTLFALTPEGHEELRKGILDYPTRDMALGLVDYSVLEPRPGFGREGRQVAIKFIAVGPEYRRQGIGAALWRELERLWPGALFPVSSGLTPGGAALRKSVGRNPADPRRRRAERAGRTGDPAELVRAAQERLRLGEQVDPWEFVPISYTFLEAWKLGKKGRVEAYRHQAFKPIPPPWVNLDLLSNEKFYVAPCSYPLAAPAGIYSIGMGTEEEQRLHLEAIEEWRNLGAIVVRLEFEAERVHLAEGHGAHRPVLERTGECPYCRWIDAYRWRVLIKDKDVRRAMTAAEGWSGWEHQDVLLPTQWDWARIMKKKGTRWKNPMDPRRRRAERAETGGVEEIVRILQARVRAGQLDEWPLWQAEFLSRPLSPEDGSHEVDTRYSFYPFEITGTDWGRNDPRTVQLNRALRIVLGDRTWGGPYNPHEPPHDEAWAEGGYLADARGPAGSVAFQEEPPWVIVMPEGNLELSDLQEDTVRRYFEAGPEWEHDALPDPAFADPGEGEVEAARWDLRTKAFEHVPWAVDLLEWLRRFSTIEYITVLGGWAVYAAWPPPDFFPPWQQVELALVSSFLGGPPL